MKVTLCPQVPMPGLEGRVRVGWLGWCTVLGVVLPLGAQQIAFSVGPLGAYGAEHRTYTWQLEYARRLDDRWGVGLSWLNEGHLPGHHRDGYTLQAGYRWTFGDGRWMFTFGGGPYRFFDTQEHPGGYVNRHGWGYLVSAGVAWVPEGTSWIGRLRLQRAIVPGNVDTHGLLLGVGYRLAPDPLPRISGGLSGPASITVFVAKTIVNSQRSELASGGALELRQQVHPRMDVTVSLLQEGDPQVLRRSGLALQLWFKRPFFGHRLELGAGFGAYYHLDLKHVSPEGDAEGRDLAGIVTPGVCWHLPHRWDVRVHWNRVRTPYNRDTDFFTFGLGRGW